MAANPDRERRYDWSHSDRDPRPGGGAAWESPTAPSPLYRNYSRYRTLGAFPAGVRLLLRCSGSIRCSIRSGTIRASKNSSTRPRRKNGKAQPSCSTERNHARRKMKYWEIIADNLSKAGWSWGCVSAIDSNGRTIWIADAHRDDGKRFVVRADEKLTAFLELESAIRACDELTTRTRRCGSG